MNNTTKKQHYIWRKYLAAWTINNSKTGKIMCMRNDKIFPVSLMNIAHENYFYGVKELSEIERKIIYQMTIPNTYGAQRTVNERWLKLYCAPFACLEKMTSSNNLIWNNINRMKIEKSQEFKNWNIEYIEKIHGIIESIGVTYISSLRQNDLSFWKNQKMRDDFAFFLASQYFRTKNMRDRIVRAIEMRKARSDFFVDIRPENMWLPLSLIFASNVGAYIAHNFSAVLLQTEDGCFIVGDQPIVNTYSTFDMMVPTEDVEFYYPITPYTALLLTKNRKYISGQILKISVDGVAKYNNLEQCAASELLFAKEREHLEPFRTKGILA